MAHQICLCFLQQMCQEKTSEVTSGSDDGVAVAVRKGKIRATYWNLLSKHPNYRWFLASYCVTHCGEWLTYVASMSLLEQYSGTTGSNSSNINGNSSNHHYLKISFLVVMRLLPNTLWSIPGGLLADTVDRQRVMVTIDVVSAGVALCFCGAAVMMEQQNNNNRHHHAMVMLYVCTVLQESLSGLYEPNRSAMVPQLVNSDALYMEKANAGLSIMWSLTAAVGGSVGGFLTARFGPVACFVTDAILYLVSALLLSWGVKGDFRGSGSSQNEELQTMSGESMKPNNESRNVSTRQMLRQLAHYLGTTSTGVYVLIKACGALLFGASDVVYTTFAETNKETYNNSNNDNININGNDPERNALDSQCLGWMFAAVGLGCLLGPLLLPDDRSHLQSCVRSYAVLGVGYGMIAASPHYWQKRAWTVLRASGAAVLWMESSILIQMATPLSLLGRVSAVDLALALTGESVSALVAGILEDAGWTADQVAFLLSGAAMLLACVWAFWSSRQFLLQQHPNSRKMLLSKDSERMTPDDDDEHEHDAEFELEPLQPKPQI